MVTTCCLGSTREVKGPAWVLRDFHRLGVGAGGAPHQLKEQCSNGRKHFLSLESSRGEQLPGVKARTEDPRALVNEVRPRVVARLGRPGSGKCTSMGPYGAHHALKHIRFPCVGTL